MQNIFTWVNDAYDKIAVEDAIMSDPAGHGAFYDCQWCTDQDVGSAGATGSGDENIKVAGAHTIVELMRQGMSPKEAGLATLRRIARNYNSDPSKLRYVDMEYYILRRDGEYAGVSLWSSAAGHGRKFLVHDGTQRMEPFVALYQGTYVEWPIVPKLK